MVAQLLPIRICSDHLSIRKAHTHASMHLLSLVSLSASRQWRQVENVFAWLSSCMGKTPPYLETCLGATRMTFSRSAVRRGPGLHVCHRFERLLCSGALSAKTKTHALQNNTPRNSSSPGYEKLVPKKEASFITRAIPGLVFFGSFVHIAN